MKLVFADDADVLVGVELTRRNLTVLLARMVEIMSGDVYVKAVEDAEHYADRAPGPAIVRGELV